MVLEFHLGYEVVAGAFVVEDTVGSRSLVGGIQSNYSVISGIFLLLNEWSKERPMLTFCSS